MNEKKTISVSYDSDVDAAYISLTKLINPGEAVDTIPLGVEDERVMSMINLDFDKEGRLLGIEIIDASKVMRKDLLDEIQ